jgi:copper chaperone
MIELTVPDMTCGHCAGVVTRSIKLEDPDARVSIALAEHRVSVETREARERIVEALREAGYPPA